MKKLLIIGMVGLLLPVAHAEWFDFSAITANDSSGFSQYVGESQLHMEVVVFGEGQSRVTFVNDGSEQFAQLRQEFKQIVPITQPTIGLV